MTDSRLNVHSALCRDLLERLKPAVSATVDHGLQVVRGVVIGVRHGQVQHTVELEELEVGAPCVEGAGNGSNSPPCNGRSRTPR